jgi:hypothetical protein
LLTKSQYLPALPAIRTLAAHPEPGVRRTAVRALGVFGHPQDFDLLVKGLAAKDTEELWSFVYALYEYEDQRAGPLLVPLLEAGDERLRAELLATLLHLGTPETVEASSDPIRAMANGDMKQRLAHELAGIFDGMKIAVRDWFALPEEEKARTLRLLVDAEKRKALAVEETERPFNRDDFEKAAAGWIAAHRFPDPSSEWVKDGNILEVATVDDLALLHRIRAAVYCRLSDECLYDAARLDGLIRWLGRSRYRSDPGLCPDAAPR